jgi:Carboxypeptidase regulatory-like domain
MRILGCLILAVIAGSAVADAVPPEGVLCLDSESRNAARCDKAPRARHSIAPRDHDRSYVWTRADGGEVLIGVVSAGAAVIDLDQDQSGALAYRITTERWPAAVTVTVESEDGDPPPRSWLIASAAKDFRLRLLGLERGTMKIGLAAEHHRKEERSANVTARAADGGSVSLRALPVIYGEVVDRRTASAIPGATVSYPNAPSPAAVTDASGHFELEVDREWPEYLRIASPGHGAKNVALPKVVADAILQPVQLSVAGSLLLTLTLPDGEERVSAELSSIDGDDVRLIAKKVVDSANAAARFDELAAGEYRLLISGRTAFERVATKIRIEEGEETTRDLEVKATDLVLAAVHRGAPVAGARVELMPESGEWRASVTTGDDGTYAGRLWQTGSYVALVEAPGHPPAFDEKKLTGTAAIRWEIRLPEQRVTGTVTAPNRAPVAEATVFLNTDDAGSSTLLRTQTDRAGKFQFPFVTPGQQTVTVNADGYLAAVRSFALDRNEGEHTVDVVLERGTTRRVRVTLANGSPAAGARIVAEAPELSMPIVTGPDGRVQVVLATRESRYLYALPREGSFAAVEIRAGDSGEALISVPPGDASILVRTQDQQLKPLTGVGLMMRYNGRLVPPVVAAAMTAHQGRSFTTGANGKTVLEHMPAGVYEFWPYFHSATPPIAASADAPARIAAGPGPNTVTLTFAARKPVTQP